MTVNMRRAIGLGIAFLAILGCGSCGKSTDSIQYLPVLSFQTGVAPQLIVRLRVTNTGKEPIPGWAVESPVGLIEIDVHKANEVSSTVVHELVRPTVRVTSKQSSSNPFATNRNELTAKDSGPDTLMPKKFAEANLPIEIRHISDSRSQEHLRSSEEPKRGYIQGDGVFVAAFTLQNSQRKVAEIEFEVEGADSDFARVNLLALRSSNQFETK